jgi:DNA-binding MarR family transcriptional regulator
MSTVKRNPVSPTVAAPVDRGPLLGALLRLSHQQLMTSLLARLHEAGWSALQPSHGAALRPLWDHPEGMRATELAAAARITKQSMAAIVEQTEANGWTERIDDERDARAKLVRLTRRGRELGADMRKAVRDIEREWARRVGSERLEALRAILLDIVDSEEKR